MEELNDIDALYDLIEKVKGAVRDDERAHSIEDKLHVEFLEFIVTYQGQHTFYTIQLLAKEILALQELDFARWCA